MFQTNVVKKNQNTNFKFSKLFPSKIVPLRKYVEKYCRARQDTEDIMAHVHTMLDT